MLLTISTTRRPATDLGFLLHKHPDRVQSFELSFGSAHVFYPDASETRCTAALLLDVDPVGLVRRRKGDSFALDQYVNDRPFVASSFLSVAIAQVFNTALGGRCQQKPELPVEDWPFEVAISVLPCRRAEGLLRELFEPLGYEVTARPHVLDASFPDWGDSSYFTVTLRRHCRLQELLTHLYVLIPVLDNEKHYYVGHDELEKLLRFGEGWLKHHPAREKISFRYLKHRRGLARAALARLADEDHPEPDAEEARHDLEERAIESEVLITEGDDVSRSMQIDGAGEASSAEADAQAVPVETVPAAGESEKEETPAEDEERKPTLNSQRLASVLGAVRAGGARSVVDLGCGEGRLLRLLLADRQFDRIVGMDVSMQALRHASNRLRLERMPAAKRQRIALMQGSLVYRDARLSGFDAATIVEVIEHLDPPRLAAFERVVFEFARPRVVVVTTPNIEYNVRFETLAAGTLRHRDHRFEWTRQEFQDWAGGVASRFGYRARFMPIGPLDSEVGSPTQMGIFEREAQGVV